jgi:hypothetical protein
VVRQEPDASSDSEVLNLIVEAAMEWHSVIAEVGMVMRGPKPVQRMPEAKLLGASMGFAEPHGHGGRAS